MIDARGGELARGEPRALLPARRRGASTTPRLAATPPYPATFDPLSERPVRLVLLPGLDGTAAPRQEFIAALAPELQAQVLVYPADRVLGYAELEPLVRAALPAEPFVLLGESYSGPLAVSIAAAAPPGLIGLVLANSFVRRPLPLAALLRLILARTPSQLLRMAASSALLAGRADTREWRGALRAALASVAPQVLHARAGEALTVDQSRALERIELPILCLRGTRDWVIPRAAAQWIKRLAPQTEVQEFAASHFLLQAQPGPAAAAVKRFAARCRFGGPGACGGVATLRKFGVKCCSWAGGVTLWRFSGDVGL